MYIVKKIRNKIAILVAAGIFFTLFPLSLVVVREFQLQAGEDLERVAFVMADFISDAVSASVELDQEDSVELALEGAKRRQQIVFVQVYNRQERLLAAYQTRPIPEVSIKLNPLSPQTYNVEKDLIMLVYPIPGAQSDVPEIVGTLILGVSAESLLASTRRFQLIGLGLGGLLFAMGALAAWFIGTTISSPLTRLSEVARQIAAGDLSQHAVARTIHLNDEIGDLAHSFDFMRGNLQRVLSHIRNAGLKMQSSSDEIFQAVNQLAVALEEQSASVLETTRMMESSTESSRKITGNTDVVVEMAERTRNYSQKGVSIAEETIGKMQEIDETNTRFLQKITNLGEHSEKIGDVIQLIHEIADQTKLIAFNAALEAVGARDGVGKRFNVVAVEIRRLADTIIESTQEVETNILEIQQGIRELVLSSDATTGRISEGSQHTETSAEWLREILDAAIHTNDEAKEIFLSVQQQQQGNEQILLALKEISDGAKQFVSAGNKASASANEMKSLAEEFSQLIDKVALDSNEAGNEE